MKRICIIPARGGSKRIPRKNIIDYMGKPMIHWTIRAACDSKLFARVVVSTDDEEISTISRQSGAEVPFLRTSFADDNSPVSVATINCLENSENFFGEKYDEVVQLMANCPNRTSDDLLKFFAEHFQKNNRFSISALRYGFLNPWWAMQSTEQQWQPLHAEAAKQRSQDLPHLLCPTGAIWVAKSNDLKTAGTFYGPNFDLIEISLQAGVDIDDYEDLKIAKAFWDFM